MLWVAPALRERLAVPTPGYGNLADPAAGLDARPWDDARCFDTPSLGAVATASALAAARVLREQGWDTVHARAAELAETFATALRERGREVQPRGRTTLVSWRSDDAEAEVAALSEAGVAVRFLPGRGLVRASVGAWNDEGDLDRLLGALPAR